MFKFTGFQLSIRLLLSFSWLVFWPWLLVRFRIYFWIGIGNFSSSNTTTRYCPVQQRGRRTWRDTGRDWLEVGPRWHFPTTGTVNYSLCLDWLRHSNRTYGHDHHCCCHVWNAEPLCPWFPHYRWVTYFSHNSNLKSFLPTIFSLIFPVHVHGNFLWLFRWSTLQDRSWSELEECGNLDFAALPRRCFWNLFLLELLYLGTEIFWSSSFHHYDRYFVHVDGRFTATGHYRLLLRI